MEKKKIKSKDRLELELEQLGLGRDEVSELVRAVWVTRLWDRIDEKKDLEIVRARIAAYRRRRRIAMVSIAASAAAVVFAAMMLFTGNEGTDAGPQFADRTLIEVPGSEIKLVATDGEEYILSDINTEVAIGASENIIRKEGGVLTVVPPETTGEAKSKGEPMKIAFKVPRGAEYQIVLADGTKVWLSAESALTFPSSFDGDIREVEISGEAYFEVKHDAAKPFVVRYGETGLQVLGTIFNIYAYPEDRTIITTLLEGSVKQSFEGDRHIVLRPSEQTRYFKDGGNVVVSKVDAEDYRAYREGKIVFRNRTLEEILLSLERTYDCRIEMSDRVKYYLFASFTITVNKAESINIPLDKLKQTGAFAYEKTGNSIRLY